MNEPAAADDDALERAVVGDPNPPGSLTDPASRRRLAGYRGLQQALDRAATAERRMLAELDAEQQGDLAFVQQALGQLATPVARPFWQRRSVLAMAATLLVAVLVYLTQSGPRDADERYLKDAEHTLSPTGKTTDAFANFSWTMLAPGAGFYRVEIESTAGERLLESPELYMPAWSLDETAARALPERILWRVRVFNANGDFIEAREASAWR